MKKLCKNIRDLKRFPRAQARLHGNLFYCYEKFYSVSDFFFPFMDLNRGLPVKLYRPFLRKLRSCVLCWHSFSLQLAQERELLHLSENHSGCICNFTSHCIKSSKAKPNRDQAYKFGINTRGVNIMA